MSDRFFGVQISLKTSDGRHEYKTIVPATGPESENKMVEKIRSTFEEALPGAFWIHYLVGNVCIDCGHPCPKCKKMFAFERKLAKKKRGGKK